jgi:hypothetical protein
MMQIRFPILLVLMFLANTANAQEYEAHFVVKKHETLYEITTHASQVIYLPVRTGYTYIGHDSLIFEERNFGIYDQAIPNAFPPPEFKTLSSIAHGRLDSLGQQWFEIQRKKINLKKQRYFFRVFRMTYEEYMMRNGIKNPWMTTYKDFEKEYSFLIEGDCVFK